MAVRPWENRFLDINSRNEGIIFREGGDTAKGKNSTRTRTQLKSTTGKRPIQSNISSQKSGPSRSDGSNSSPGKSVNMLEANQTVVSKPKPRPDITSRSHSNLKERSAYPEKQAKKRLSLPNSGKFFLKK